MCTGPTTARNSRQRRKYSRRFLTTPCAWTQIASTRNSSHHVYQIARFLKPKRVSGCIPASESDRKVVYGQQNHSSPHVTASENSAKTPIICQRYARRYL